MLSLDPRRLSLTSTSAKATPVTPAIFLSGRCRAQPTSRCQPAAPTMEVEGPSTSCSATPSDKPFSRHGGSHRLARSCVVARANVPDDIPLASDAGKIGVVIVDHGSRKKASNDMLIEFGNLYGELTGHEIVEVAHMEIAAPTIEDAVGRCAARGATTVVVAPYFLSRGRHIQEDIPALVREAQERHPGLRCVIADPIGIDPLMVQLISNRVAAALQGGANGTSGTNGANGVTVTATAAGGAVPAGSN